MLFCKAIPRCCRRFLHAVAAIACFSLATLVEPLLLLASPGEWACVESTIPPVSFQTRFIYRPLIFIYIRLDSSHSQMTGLTKLIDLNFLTSTHLQEPPYHNESTASLLLSEVKHCRARLVLRWGTTLESLVWFFWSILPDDLCWSGGVLLWWLVVVTDSGASRGVLPTQRVARDSTSDSVK